MISSVSKTVLSDGIRVITAEMPHVYSVAISVFIFAGSRDEPEHQPGIAHFTEHLSSAAYLGIKDSDPAIFTAQNEMNAFTTKEIFAVITRLASPLEQKVTSTLRTIFALSVSHEDVLLHRNKICQEIEKTLRDYHLLASILLEREVWKGHKLGRPTMGDASYIKKATVDEAVEYLSSILHPSRVVVSTAGRIKHPQAIKLCEELFLDRMGTHNFVSRRQPYIDKQEEPQVRYIPLNMPTHVALGVKCFPKSDRDFLTLSILAYLCEKALTSSLLKSIKVRLHGYEDTGFFLITVGVINGKKV